MFGPSEGPVRGQQVVYNPYYYYPSQETTGFDMNTMMSFMMTIVMLSLMIGMMKPLMKGVSS